MNPASSRPVLLIVDDDAPLRQLVVSAAERTGAFAAIHQAEDGLAGLQAVRTTLREHAVDGTLLVLSDLSMPGLDGFELVRELKNDEGTRDVPVAIMTSSSRSNDRDDAFAAGCSAFFYKPQGLGQFMELVATLPQLCHGRARVAVE